MDDSCHIHSLSPLPTSDQVQGSGYSESEVETDTAGLQLETSAVALELEMDVAALELETDATGLVGDERTYSWIGDISGFGDRDRYASGTIEVGEVFGWLGVVDVEDASDR
jgi:hypothetical protein